jgi:hypothetical protein
VAEVIAKALKDSEARSLVVKTQDLNDEAVPGWLSAIMNGEPTDNDELGLPFFVRILNGDGQVQATPHLVAFRLSVLRPSSLRRPDESSGLGA